MTADSRTPLEKKLERLQRLRQLLIDGVKKAGIPEEHTSVNFPIRMTSSLDSPGTVIVQTGDDAVLDDMDSWSWVSLHVAPRGGTERRSSLRGYGTHLDTAKAIFAKILAEVCGDPEIRKLMMPIECPLPPLTEEDLQAALTRDGVPVWLKDWAFFRLGSVPSSARSQRRKTKPIRA